MSQKKRISIITGIAIVALAIISFGVWKIVRLKNKATFHIAYVGRYSSLSDDAEAIARSANFHKIHEFALKKYIGQFNDGSEIKLSLKIFNNYKSPDSTTAIYERIAKDTTIIAIIDNCWGSELAGGSSEVIKRFGLPFISINADKNNLDFGTNSIFTGNGDYVPDDIAAFLKKAFQVDSVNFISESNYMLHNEYLKEFDTMDIHIANQLLIKSTKLAENDFTVADLKKVLANDHMTVINTHSEIGTHIINQINEFCANEVIVGHAQIASTSDLKSFTGSNKMLLSTQSENAVPLEILSDINDFKRQNKDLSTSLNLALFIERCKNAWSIVEKAIVDNPKVNRAETGKKFNFFIQNGLLTDYDILNFNSDGSLIRESSIVEFTKSGENAYTLQLNSEKKLIPNLSFGIEIIDIHEINLNTNSFSADFFYWIKSDSALDQLGSYITFQNIKPSESAIELITEKSFKSLHYRLYKVSGIFLENFDERDYPFDRQELAIDIQLLSPAERLRVSFDKESFEQNLKNLSLNGWEHDYFNVTVDNTISNKLKGNLDISASEFNKFKNITFRFNVQRSFLPGILQIVLPLFFIGSIAVGLLFMKSLQFSEVGETMAAVFLTIIAFSISLGDITPSGNILTKTDLLFILTLIIVVMSFGLVLLHNINKGLSFETIKVLRKILMILYLALFNLMIFY